MGDGIPIGYYQSGATLKCQQRAVYTYGLTQLLTVGTHGVHK